jgi:thiosulfate/3-mercaptopyruvate sulfurtransferase
MPETMSRSCTSDGLGDAAMTTSDGYARPELLAEPDWLWDRRDDPDLRIIDCGSPDGYDRAHIPGAVRLGQGEYSAGQTRPDPWDPWLKDPADPLHVVKAEAFAALMGLLGVSAGTTVVAYDDFNGTFATRLWWVLAYYGHAGARVLNGGWQRWLCDDRPVTFRETMPAPGLFTPRPVEAMRIRLDELKSRYADPDVQIVNVLPRGWYLGRDNPFGNRQAGHIPGSANVPIERFFADESVPALKSAAELRAELARAGLSPAKETVVHCQAGIRTTLGVLVLSLLGWERVRTYEASLGE